MGLQTIFLELRVASLVLCLVPDVLFFIKKTRTEIKWFNQFDFQKYGTMLPPKTRANGPINCSRKYQVDQTSRY